MINRRLLREMAQKTTRKRLQQKVDGLLVERLVERNGLIMNILLGFYLEKSLSHIWLTESRADETSATL